MVIISATIVEMGTYKFVVEAVHVSKYHNKAASHR